jgi:2-dehydro-3-deoxygluconokinase
VSKSADVWQLLEQTHLVALLNPKDPAECLTAYETLAELGVVLEVALRGQAALPSIEAVLVEHPEALLLAGTVMTREQAEKVIAAGVAGVVSADYIPAVVETCVASDVMSVPGGLNDVGKQLAQKAECYGLSLEELREQRPWQWVYKVFPAMADERAVREMARAWRSVYPSLKLVYTGGVTLDNVGRLASHDPNGIYCGSAVAKHVGDPEVLFAEATRWLSEIRRGRGDEFGDAVSAREQVAPRLREAAPQERSPSVVTVGEIMLRLAPPLGERIRRARSFDAHFGGAEANVAASLAQFGVESRYVTALPDNDLGLGALDVLRALGVDVSHVLRRGNRIGIYYLEHGASQRPSRIIYDRADSAICELGPGQIDWDAVFAGAQWFHWTGITPALSQEVAAATAEAVEAAKRLALTVSVDLNYRAKLWSHERARAVMAPLVGQADVVVANEADAADVFGIGVGRTMPERGELDLRVYEDVARELVDRFELRMAAITLRQSHSASENTWSACLWDGKEFHTSSSYRIRVVDRVGGGDAFTAGLIYGLLTGKGHAEALEFAVAASCLKQTIMGDFNLVTVDEVEKLVGGDVAGRIKR